MIPSNFLHEIHSRRHRFDTDYRPDTGIGACGQRVRVAVPASGGGTALIPVSMTADPEYAAARSDITAWQRLRCRHDFEYWAVRCVRIKDKLSGHIIPFTLNAPQRKVLAVLEDDRLAGRPIRLILLKARQWGGSTLVQMYMAWIQTTQCRNWHSLICGHLKDTARSILGMYDAMIQSYPEELWEGVAPAAFRPFERSTNIRELAGRGCRVTVASAESQEALRGADIAMAHLSETAFWPETRQKSPLDYMRTVCGSVALRPLTLIAIESTANGTGNFFHDEWQRNVAGRGDKHAVFIPWYDIEIYRKEPLSDEDALALWPRLTAYEQNLWYEYGLSIEQVAWYHDKAREYASLDQMHAEFPTTPDEAFINTGANVFAAADIERLRAGCRPPMPRKPADIAARLASGRLDMWETPLPDTAYIATVDVGGRSSRADWSVIAILATPSSRLNATSGVHFDDSPQASHNSHNSHNSQSTPRVVAQWRGHVDHDILADYAMALGRYYNNALLVVEANTLETENMESSTESVLYRMYDAYPNLYCRNTAPGPRRPGLDSGSRRPGLHTNRATKAAMIDTLIQALRPRSDVNTPSCVPQSPTSPDGAQTPRMRATSPTPRRVAPCVRPEREWPAFCTLPTPLPEALLNPQPRTAPPKISYIERSDEACNELAAYVCMPNGSYQARPGKHDDILMTRAMALYILADAALRPPAPRADLTAAMAPVRPW